MHAKQQPRTQLLFLLPVLLLLAPSTTASPADQPHYRSPLQVAAVPGTALVVVTNHQGNSVSLVDLDGGQVVRETPVGREPTGVAVRADGKLAAVACRYSDELYLFTLPDLQVAATVPVPNQPYDVEWTGRDRLWVSCMGKDEVVVEIDVAQRTLLRRISVAQNPRHLAVSRDGRYLFVACDAYDLSRPVVQIELASGKIVGRFELRPASNLRDLIEVAPGVLAVAHLIPKPFVPLTQVRQGWVNNNAISFIRYTASKDQVQTVILDEAHRYFANPYGLAVGPEGRRLFVVCAGVDEVLVYDLPRLLAEASRLKGQRGYVPLGASRPYRLAVIPVGRNPYGIALVPRADVAVVANRLADTLSVIDLGHLTVGTSIPVGETARITMRRRGEILYNSATLCFQRQFSCASCHPEGHTTGLSWDLEDDGLGNVKNIRSFRGVDGTGPFRWQGEAAEIGANECGPTVTLAMRGSPLSPADLEALESYVRSVPLVPNPYRMPDGSLSEAARRGKQIFEGKARCIKCHSGPKFTNRKRRDVGTGKGRYAPLKLPSGNTIYPTQFDVPQLVGIWDSPPYLHDGRARTLREVFTKYNPEDKHGKTSQLTEQELSDLIAYLLSL